MTLNTVINCHGSIAFYLAVNKVRSDNKLSVGCPPASSAFSSLGFPLTVWHLPDHPASFWPLIAHLISLYYPTCSALFQTTSTPLLYNGLWPFGDLIDAQHPALILFNFILISLSPGMRSQSRSFRTQNRRHILSQARSRSGSRYLRIGSRRAGAVQNFHGDRTLEKPNFSILF